MSWRQFAQRLFASFPLHGVEVLIGHADQPLIAIGWNARARPTGHGTGHLLDVATDDVRLARHEKADVASTADINGDELRTVRKIEDDADVVEHLDASTRPSFTQVVLEPQKPAGTTADPDCADRVLQAARSWSETRVVAVIIADQVLVDRGYCTR